MGSYYDDDRRYEERREYFREEDRRREDRDRTFWQDYDRRVETERIERNDERRRREAEYDQAREDFRKGHTAQAISRLMGPEYGIDYFNRLLSHQTRDATSTAHRKPKLVKHSFVHTAKELIDNVEHADKNATFTVQRIDKDGDAVVNVQLRDTSQTFWVKAPLLWKLNLDVPIRTMCVTMDLMSVYFALFVPSQSMMFLRYLLGEQARKLPGWI